MKSLIVAKIALRLPRGKAFSIRARLELVHAMLGVRIHDSGDWTTRLLQRRQTSDGFSRGRIAILVSQYPELRHVEIGEHGHGVVLRRHSFEQKWKFPTHGFTVWRV
jgi:hypothetical protein